MECFVKKKTPKQIKWNNAVKIKNNSCFSITQLLLRTMSIKINFGRCIAFVFIQYLYICCPITTVPKLISCLFNALILILIELLVINMFFAFSLFLLVNTNLLSVYLTNLTIMGLFLPLLGTPILCVRSLSPGKISKFISLLFYLQLFHRYLPFDFPLRHFWEYNFPCNIAPVWPPGMAVCQLFRSISKPSPLNYWSFHLFSNDWLRVRQIWQR